MLKPLKNKVIVSVKKNEKTEGGLMLTSNFETDNVTGTIIAVSNNYSNDEKLNVGDTIIISKLSGNKIQYLGNEYIVIDINNILAIVEEE